MSSRIFCRFMFSVFLDGLHMWLQCLAFKSLKHPLAWACTILLPFLFQSLTLKENKKPWALYSCFCSFNLRHFAILWHCIWKQVFVAVGRGIICRCFLSFWGCWIGGLQGMLVKSAVTLIFIFSLLILSFWFLVLHLCVSIRIRFLHPFLV